MKRLLDTFWIVVLIVSIGAVGGGFIGGRSIGRASVVSKRTAAPAHVPDAIVVEPFVRVLSGAHSFDLSDASAAARLPLENAVAARPEGWAPPFAPHLHAPSKLALVLVDCGREPAVERPFIEGPIPLTIACDAKSDESAALVDLAHESGKMVLVQFDAADAAGHDARATIERRYDEWNARGLLGMVATDERSGADALLAYLARRHGVAVDTMGDPEAVFYHRARAKRLRALTRDVIADTRDERAYTAFMLQTAVGISRRSGVAVVAIHAKPRTYEELMRFAKSASRNDVDLVALDAL